MYEIVLAHSEVVLRGFAILVGILCVYVGLESVEFLADVVANVLVRLLGELVNLGSCLCACWKTGKRRVAGI